MTKLASCASAFVGGLCLWCAVISAAGASDLTGIGQAILQEKCGRCHAVERFGDSPLKIAPPMRDVYARYAARELGAELLEGMVSKHKEMPQIEFSEEQVDAILAYLYEISARK